ncbi:ferric reductase-like transmembrane domain-containing protein [Paenarthrobacter sp. CC6]|uniref:ferric reductase-like transmembrane domain-containing protein n=1 Tax=Paenarthrobacter sp. CC6 TaxID=3029184 RepID=UPI00339CB4E4
MPGVSEVFWFLSRAGGITASVLLTLTFILGVMTSGRRRPEGIGTTVVTGLHRNLALGMMLFLVLHVATAVADGYVDIAWVAVFLPFAAGYERAWIGLGAIAVDLLLAVILTSVLRQRIPERWWAPVHVATYVLWPASIVHGIMMGTGSAWILRAVGLACLAAGTVAIVYRFMNRQPDETRRGAIGREPWR